MTTENTLYYGDNLKILRDYIQDESVDLIYLDPPFNSNRSYNVLFKDEDGTGADTQIKAFDDSWHWGETAELTYRELVQNAPINVGTMIEAMRKFIGTNQMMAYLVMMAIRLLELRRVLKNSGSLFLHCDPAASHYLKILLDITFHPALFRNEIIWNYGRGASNIKTALPKGHETILFYAKSENNQWSAPTRPYSDKLLKLLKKDDKGFYYTRGSRTGRRMIADWEKESKVGLKTYIDPESGGTKCTDVWNDVGGYPRFGESLGYPTQKPLALLERIIQSSSNPGDVVMDPFSGCGTAITAAQKLDRHWIGIDISHLAIAMHKSRLQDMFGLEPGRDYKVIGEPEDLWGAQQLAKDDRYQFQWWALSLAEARPLGEQGGREGKKGSDRGVDGIIRFFAGKDKFGTAIVQVKSGHVNSSHIRDLKGVLEREKAEVGIYITLEDPTRDMETEALDAGYYHSDLWQKDYRKIQILTIEQLLGGKDPDLPVTPPEASPYKQAEKVKKNAGAQGKLDI